MASKDLKAVQTELKNDIFHHQTLMQELKKDPLNDSLKLKLKAVQQHIGQLGSKQKRILHGLNIASDPDKLKVAVPNDARNSTFTLVTIKNGTLRPNASNKEDAKVVEADVGAPINLSSLPTKTDTTESLPTVLVVTTPSSQNTPTNSVIKSTVTSGTSQPISLSSLVSTGGVVTLAGGWKTTQPSVARMTSKISISDPARRMLAGQQVQIKVPVRQNQDPKPPLIFVPPQSSKSLFRLLPKGCHPTPVSRSRKIFNGQKHAILNSQRPIAASQISTSKLSDKNQTATSKSYQQFVVHRLGGSVSQASSTNGKDQLKHFTPVFGPVGKSHAGLVAVSRLVSTSLPKNVFHPIQPKEDGVFTKSTSVVKQFPSPVAKNVPSISSTSHSNFRPVEKVSEVSCDLRNMGGVDDATRAKMDFLRVIDLIPIKEAERVRSRRFRKRRIAANPVYSSGVYISGELETKRQCPESVFSAYKTINPPDVIVKRPRGRPRGSTKVSSQANAAIITSVSSRAAQMSAPSPIAPARMEEFSHLRGILEMVASASKAVYSVGTGSDVVGSSRQLKRSMSFSNAKTSVSELVKEVADAPSQNRVSDQDGDVDEHEDQCASCGHTGEVLMCDTCSRVYHLSCTVPPLTTVPQGMWVCSTCKRQFADSKPEVKWPGIVSMVHSYVEHDRQREGEVEVEKQKLNQSKKLIAGLKLQAKTLISVVMDKVELRAESVKEKQAIHNKIADMRNLIQRVWDASIYGRTSKKE